MSMIQHELDFGHCRARLVQGDCLEVLRGSPAASVDVVVTSPPYNLGVAYSAYDDTAAREEYLDWMESWVLEVRRVLSPGGSLFLNLGSKPTDPWGPFEVLMRVRPHLSLQNVIHWVKSIAIDKADVGNYGRLDADIMVGHYKPINSPRYLNDCHEYVFHLTLEGKVPLDRLAVGVPYQDKSNVSRWSSAARDLHCRGNTWFVPYRTIRSRSLQRPHPASFPVELARKCLLLHGVRPGLRAMDPFLGIGHAGVAALGLGLDFLGVELDPEYFEVACRELSRAGLAGPDRSEGFRPRSREGEPQPETPTGRGRAAACAPTGTQLELRLGMPIEEN